MDGSVVSVMGSSWDLLGAAYYSGSFVGVHGLSAGGRKAPVRTEPLPTALSVALYLEQIVLVLVVVLDLLWVNRSALVTRAARFGRSLSLPL